MGHYRLRMGFKRVSNIGEELVAINEDGQKELVSSEPTPLPKIENAILKCKMYVLL